MPIYLYICDDCGHELESLQKISDDPLKDCPGCGQSTLRKQVTAAAFRLKGTGWYETDFKHGDKKDKKEQKKDKADGGADAKQEKKEGKKDIYSKFNKNSRLYF